MRGVLLIWLCLILETGWSQTDEDTKTKILSNDVNKSFFSFGPTYTIYFADFNTSIFTLGLNGHFYSPRFSFVCDAKYHVWDRIGFTTELPSDVSSIYKPDPSRSLSIVPTFNFIKVEKKQDVRVVVWSRMAGKRTYYKYVDVRANVGHRLGLNAGIQMGTTFYYMPDLAVTAIGLDGSQYLLGNGGLASQDLSSFLNYGVLKLGFSYINSKQVTITTRWGDKSNNGIVQVYANALIPSYRQMDDVYYKDPDLIQDQDVLVQMDIQSNMPFRETGFVLGVNVHGMDKFNFEYSAEVGMLPGPRQNLKNDTYLDLTLRFNWVKMVNKALPVDPQLN